MGVVTSAAENREEHKWLDNCQSIPINLIKEENGNSHFLQLAGSI